MSAGSVSPATATGSVSVELLRKKKRRGFVPVKTADASLVAGAFTDKFKNPKRTKKCEAVASYAGDATYAPSSSTLTFKC